MEGDPKIKERRRRILGQIAGQRMLRDVPDADVVIADPARVAVAIRYDASAMPAPRIVAKGEGAVARRGARWGEARRAQPDEGGRASPPLNRYPFPTAR